MLLKKLLLPIMLVAFLLFGCINVSDSQKLTKPSTEIKIFEDVQDDCADIGGPTPCTCLVCQNKTSTPPWFSIFRLPVDTSLKGGNCSFAPCNGTIFADLVTSTDNVFAQRFLLGQGASFFEFREANKYCNNSLSLAIKWMVGDRNSPPRTPSSSRAACLLERNVIPLYIYYTNGSNINSQAARDIGDALRDAGPAIVTPEINFNSSDPFAVSKVKSQIHEYKAACPNCLIALSPKDMDMEAVEKFRSDANVWGKIDIIGQGIILNKEPNGTCDVEALIGKRMAFAKNVLNKYHKPTIWLYVGISNGTQDINKSAGCTFTNKTVAKAYEYIMGIMQPLISTGVIGYSPYTYLDGTAPLDCTGDACNFGLMNSNGDKKEPQFSSWFSHCQYYTQEGVPSYVSYSTNGLGNRCSYADNYKMFTRLISEAGDAYEPPDLNLQEAEVKIGCDSCISYNTSLPGNFGSRISVDEDFCTQYPLLDAVPDRFDVSPLLMRAIFAQESSFDACSISYVPPDTTACNNIGLTAENLAQYATDAGCPPPSSQMCVKINRPHAGDPSGDCTACGSSEATSTLCKPCAFGIAQCIELPGREYAAGALPPVLSQCGGENYNPFNPQESACCGSTKMYEFIKVARGIISNHAQLRTAADREWYEAYLALMSYHGGSARTISNVTYYYGGGSADDSCYQSHKDTLIAYLFSCVDGYPKEVLGKYQGFVNACNTDCRKS